MYQAPAKNFSTKNKVGAILILMTNKEMEARRGCLPETSVLARDRVSS